MTNPTNPTGIPGGDAGGFGGVGAFLPMIGGIYDSYQSNKTARENTDKTIAAQKEMAELAYQRSIQMWHMQNAYNSPEKQMERFGAAGLNPHLIYGQGSSGNNSSTPQYSPPNIQYKYAAPAYGAAVSSVLPTLMAVGTWMQNMRQSEADIKLKEGNISRVEQLVGFLEKRNPQVLSEGQNRLSIFPYQFDAQRWATSQANAKFQDFIRETEFKWDHKKPYELNIMAMKQEAERYKTNLLQAQSSYTDMDITNPQALIQMVLGGVMGLAGQQLRLSTYKPQKSKVTTRYDNRGKRVYQRVDRE